MSAHLPTSVSLPSRKDLYLRTAGRALLLCLVGGLLLTNILLIKQNRSLKAALAHNQPEFLSEGEYVPSIVGNTLSGERQIINYSNKPKTVLLVFSPDCRACQQSIPYWKEIRAACDRKDYQVFGVSLGDAPKTTAFLASNGLSLAALVDVDVQTKQAYKLNLTPLTIVIDREQRVEKIWPGTFNAKLKLDVENYFGISIMNRVE